MVGGRFKKQRTYIPDLSWAAEIQVDLHSHPPNVKSSYRGLHWVESHMVSAPYHSHGCVLGADSGSGDGKWNPHSKDMGGNEELPMAGVQLTGLKAVASSQ